MQGDEQAGLVVRRLWTSYCQLMGQHSNLRNLQGEASSNNLYGVLPNLLRVPSTPYVVRAAIYTPICSSCRIIAILMVVVVMVR